MSDSCLVVNRMKTPVEIPLAPALSTVVMLFAMTTVPSGSANGISNGVCVLKQN